jgi:peptidoglycan biosynthesis protein MviN/MurJ (putative lipid II flippase)
MADIAIGILWFLVGLILLAGVIYLAIWVIEQFIMPIPEMIKKGVWVIVLLIALIYLITVLVGGGHPIRLFPKVG